MNKISKDMVKNGKLSYYAVKQGRVPGLYRTWKKCEEQIKGFPSASFKKFTNKKEAEDWLSGKIEDTYDKDLGKQLRSQGSSKSKCIVYTDGSCPNNGQTNSKGGAGVHFDTDEYQDISHTIEAPATNNVAELTAIKMATIVLMDDIINGREIEIYTDSEYSMNALTIYGDKHQKQGWKSKKGEKIANVELIRPSYDLIQRYPNIKLIHIRAHTGNKDPHSIGNDIADKLAWTAATKDEQLEITDFIFPFGKYRGRKIIDVIEEDSKYISWVKKNKTMPNLVKYSRFIDSIP
jgi:ribonuclease HI